MIGSGWCTGTATDLRCGPKHLLQAGVDITVIALWLGHGSPTTTHGYVEADLAMKKRAHDSIGCIRLATGSPFSSTTLTDAVT